MSIVTEGAVSSEVEVHPARGAARLLKPEIVAAMLDVRMPTVYEHARTGLLPCVRIGRAVRFRQSDITAFIESGGQAHEGGWRKEAA